MLRGKPMHLYTTHKIQYEENYKINFCEYIGTHIKHFTPCLMYACIGTYAHVYLWFVYQGEQGKFENLWIDSVKQLRC